MASIKAGGSALIFSKWLTPSPSRTITVTLTASSCGNARGCRCRRYRNGEIHLRTYRERHPDQIKPRIRRMAPYSPGGASCAWYREARPGDVLQALVRERRESIRVGGKPG